MNLPENVFENPYKAGQYLQFNMNLAEMVPALISVLDAYQTYAISENLSYVQSLLEEKGVHFVESQLAEFFSIHDVLACLFGQYGDLDVESVWNEYLILFTKSITEADLKSAGQTIFNAYCFRAHKLESVQEQWS
ncbi:hypothetical protein AO073_01765 [Pseudomonas syringae ICMP 11293]|uniref:hypothetical protein n=1 Tax=Pseudomonas syringae TaxID=317 RepID=UPI0007316768|nr:hypothetical protein [Pseudomonas syringae]KTB91626.1 hypothetical protein AO073_01765 [Pseudomonas syringae ICMP 11293]